MMSLISLALMPISRARFLAFSRYTTEKAVMYSRPPQTRASSRGLLIMSLMLAIIVYIPFYLINLDAYSDYLPKICPRIRNTSKIPIISNISIPYFWNIFSILLGDKIAYFPPFVNEVLFFSLFQKPFRHMQQFYGSFFVRNISFGISR